jgi:hypothetical protein
MYGCVKKPIVNAQTKDKIETKMARLFQGSSRENAYKNLCLDLP